MNKRLSLKKIIIVSILFILCNSLICMSVYAENETIKSFMFKASNNTQLNYDIKGYIKGKKIYCFLPYGVNKSNLVASIESNSKNIKVGTSIQIPEKSINDFSNTVQYILDDNINNSYEVIAMSSNIPTIEIETESKKCIDSKEDYIVGNMNITGNEKYSTGIYNGAIKIRGRGNSTWVMPKKSYKIKLDERSEILGMNPEKEWALIANHMDKTLIRNKLVFDLASEFGLNYTPNSVSIDLIINGEYYGNYLLCEQIKVSENRVNIEKLDKEIYDESLIKGGYLLEIDKYEDSDTCFQSNLGLSLALKGPKKPNEVQLNYIKEYINNFESAISSSTFLYNGKHYSEYIDVDSFVNWYILMELIKNVDSRDFSSIYLYKDRNGKLTMGPVWDFDRAAGNINYYGCGECEGWWIKTSTWYSRLFDDEVFRRKVKMRYEELEPIIDSINYKIDEYVDEIDSSQKMNFIKWNVADKYKFQNINGTGSFMSEINYLKEWITRRNTWLYKEFNSVYTNEFVGQDRYETAIRLSQSKYLSSDTVILVNGLSLIDGLTVSPIAAHKKAPILFTEKQEIKKTTLEEIKRLKAKNIILVGGSNVIDENVINQLKTNGLENIERLGGKNRSDTSLVIAKYIDENCYEINDFLICSENSIADSMSVSTVSGEFRMPIILTKKDCLDKNIYDWLKSKNLNNAYIIGGNRIISDNIIIDLNDITKTNIIKNRINGQDRYETNAKVIEKFYKGNMKNIYVVNGINLVDALPAGPIGAIHQSPIFLVDKKLSIEQLEVLKRKKISGLIKIGGHVSNNILREIQNVLK